MIRCPGFRKTLQKNTGHRKKRHTKTLFLERFPEARNRINMIYMVLFFIGGALGASLGTAAYERWGWEGVSVYGIMCTVLLTIIHAIFYKKPVQTKT